MTFQIFLFYFLPAVLLLYYAAPFRARTALIAVSSYVFYGWANPIWAVIMFFGSSVDYVCGLALVKTGDQSYCFVGEWDSFDNIVAARPGMLGMLDSFRDMLEDLGNGLGVTDPVSGETVLQLKTARAKASAKPKKKAAAKAMRKPAKKKKAAKKKATKRRRR